MFLLLSVFVLASVAIPEVVPDPMCEELKQCLRDLINGPKGTWYWLSVEGRPNHNDWIEYINSTCNDWQGRYECSTSQACSEGVRRFALFVWKEKERMCSPRGRQFLERIYTEAPQCLGNSTFGQNAVAKRQACFAQRNLNPYHVSEACADATEARDCYREWAGERCGDLFRWLVDEEWDVRYELYFPACYPRPNKFQWPSS